MAEQKYHISPETGRPNICRAGKRPCPIGGEHYDSKEEARAGYEKAMEKSAVAGSLTQKMIEEQAEKETFNRRIAEALKAQDRDFYWVTEDDQKIIDKYSSETRRTASENEAVRTNSSFAVHALRDMQERRGGGNLIATNGGAYWRLQPAYSQWTVQLQGAKDGIYIRFFDASVPVYGEQRQESWVISTPKNPDDVSNQINDLFKKFEETQAAKGPIPMWG